MKIEYKDYVLTPTDVCKDRFDLYKKGVYKSGKNIGKTKETIIGYGYSFEIAIDTIIKLEIADNNDVTTIEELVKEYRKLLLETRSHFKGIFR